MQLNSKQIELINRQIQRLVQSDSYYGKMYRELGIDGIHSQEDFEKLPFSSKDDLRNAYPLGIQAVPDSEIVRIHSSSGTTGKPVIIPYTAKDVDDWATMFARCYEIAGIGKLDRIQITPGYGLWTAGIGFQLGAEKLGAMAIPMGPGNTEKQLQMMVDLQSTVISATSSYALLLAEEVAKRGLKDKIALKKGVIGSERWGDKMRARIKSELGITLYDIYGLTEVYGPGIGISCDAEDGIHYWDDYVYLEVVDPVTGKPVPDGEEGEIVLTTLVKEGAPLIRFRTHDLSRIIPGECKCGCKYPRIDIIKGRIVDYDPRTSEVTIKAVYPDWPMMVTLPGSPPKLAMLLCTHLKAATMSSVPALPESAKRASSVATEKSEKPNAPSRWLMDTKTMSPLRLRFCPL